MPPIAVEWLNLLVRWTHVIAGILWIGDSFLFMWMDKSLVPPSRPRPGDVVGELWMVHSGGFYEVVKRRKLLPDELPASLHWFKWEAYATWISGFFLLGIVYFLSGGVYLVDPAVSRIGLPLGVALSLGLLVAGWFVYDGLCRSPLAKRPLLLGLIGFALIVAVAFGLSRLVSGRATFVLTGAMLGTIMVANVWRVIIPGQNAMLAATRAAAPVDTSHGARAKLRSTHNHYLTFPVLFTMLSNHFPSTYGHPWNWLVLVLMMVFAAAIKYVMNFRAKSHPAVALAGAAALIAVIVLTARPPHAAGVATAATGGAPVSFATAHAILERRCVTCHATHPSNPSFPQPPSGIVLEDPARIRALAPRILARAVVTRTMPLGNLTGMTEEERAQLGAWIAQGAPIDDVR
jgi:uncharacterized membrane protein